MNTDMKYVHTNLIARDWHNLAQFYIDVFHCKPVYPERDLSGEWVDQLTGLPGARITGIHLRLPGYDQGPTLEIFSYEPEDSHKNKPGLNCQGLGHLAFHVHSVDHVLRTLLAHGGEQVGEVICRDYGELGVLTAVYARDPEGNIIEIQNWCK
ncbi:hypothetical protein P22_3951 [Propionispora sp. 2/2-37]|uniref:VOC family protein n=1 Tax=Propionispora sp. 2/2-37 TaxID=1677858 RepID=UPI0006BB75CE|nr:VOC family protein [Propionispora sp. 2/2-37]CUH97805.1 hypothetical protein P22_3951 [Propionispora sp. 2/2-37]